MLTMDGEAVVYRESPMPLPLRLFVLFLGLCLTFVAPAPFLLNADWGAPSPTLILAMLCVVAFTAVGLFCIRVALVSPAELRFDPQTGHVTRRLRGPLVNRVDSFALSAMPAPETFMRDSVEDAAFAVLRLRMPVGRTIDIADFRTQAEAERWRDFIERLCRPA